MIKISYQDFTIEVHYLTYFNGISQLLKGGNIPIKSLMWEKKYIHFLDGFYFVTILEKVLRKSAKLMTF